MSSTVSVSWNVLNLVSYAEVQKREAYDNEWFPTKYLMNWWESKVILTRFESLN